MEFLKPILAHGIALGAVLWLAPLVGILSLPLVAILVNRLWVAAILVSFLASVIGNALAMLGAVLVSVKLGVPPTVWMFAIPTGAVWINNRQRIRRTRREIQRADSPEERSGARRALWNEYANATGDYIGIWGIFFLGHPPEIIHVPG